MCTLNKKRIFNIFTLSSVILLPLVLFMSFFIQSSMLDVLFFDSFSDIPVSETDEARKILINSMLNWSYYHINSNIYTPLFYPLFATLPVLFFTLESGNYMQFIFSRKKNYVKTLLLRCLSYSFLSGTLMMLGYFIFIFIGYLIGVKSSEFDFGLFTDVFPNLMNSNPFIASLLHGVAVYFVFGFVFGFFASTIALNTTKGYLVIAIPHVYYLLFGNIISTVSGIFENNEIHKFSPWYPVTITGEASAHFLGAYYYAIPILTITIVLLIRRFKSETKVSFE